MASTTEQPRYGTDDLDAMAICCEPTGDGLPVDQLVRPFSFAIQGEPYSLSVARDLWTREESYRFMRAIYAERGWGKPHPSGMHYSLFELLPDSVTLVVRKDDEIVATMTVVIDSPLGLPDDENFGDELNRLRSNGRKLAEIISLGIRQDVRGRGTILVKLFNFGHFAACGVKGATDFVITVLPHHTAFYCRKMLFEKRGETRYQKKTGVTVDLLRLDLDLGDAEIRRAHTPAGSRTIYGQFSSLVETPELVAALRREMAMIDMASLSYFVAAKPELLSGATSEQRDYVRRYVAHAAEREAWYRSVLRGAGSDGPLHPPEPRIHWKEAENVVDALRWRNAAMAV